MLVDEVAHDRVGEQAAALGEDEALGGELDEPVGDQARDLGTAGGLEGGDRETLDEETRHTERVLLEVRLREGMPVELADAKAIDAVVADGLGTVSGDRLVLTRRGRLLADHVVRRLLD